MQCDGVNGACPDERIGGRNDASALDGQRVNGVTTVVYQRTLDVQPGFDQRIPLVGRVNVIASIGPLNSRKEANYHSHRTGPTEDHRIDFTSRGVNQCPVLLAPPAKPHGAGVDEADEDDSAPAPVPTTTENPNQPWKPAIISGETNFTARIGPTGGKRGYSAITGHVSWGISWYINDLLIPEIYVERGETYTFVVQGGRRHLLSISSSPPPPPSPWFPTIELTTELMPQVMIPPTRPVTIRSTSPTAKRADSVRKRKTSSASRRSTPESSLTTTDSLTRQPVSIVGAI